MEDSQANPAHQLRTPPSGPDPICGCDPRRRLLQSQYTAKNTAPIGDARKCQLLGGSFVMQPAALSTDRCAGMRSSVCSAGDEAASFSDRAIRPSDPAPFVERAERAVQAAVIGPGVAMMVGRQVGRKVAQDA